MEMEEITCSECSQGFIVLTKLSNILLLFVAIVDCSKRSDHCITKNMQVDNRTSSMLSVGVPFLSNIKGHSACRRGQGKFVACFRSVFFYKLYMASSWRTPDPCQMNYLHLVASHDANIWRAVLNCQSSILPSLGYFLPVP